MSREDMCADPACGMSRAWHKGEHKFVEPTRAEAPPLPALALAKLCRYCGLAHEGEIGTECGGEFVPAYRAEAPQGETCARPGCGQSRESQAHNQYDFANQHAFEHPFVEPAAQPETGDEARVTRVWVVTETYRYENERGGVPVAVFASEASARADCEQRREAKTRDSDYDYDVMEWEVAYTTERCPDCRVEPKPSIEEIRAEAYAAGRADALKVIDDRIATMRGGPRLAEAREIRDAIAARRGSGR